MTLREIILFSKGADGDFLFEMVERANSDCIFLVYDKQLDHQETRKEVRKFVPQFKKEYRDIFTQESLQKIKTETTYMS